MKTHRVKCDMCNVKEKDMLYNGEHYLCPKNWYALYDDNNSRMTNLHICDTCFLSLSIKPKAEESND